MLRSLWFKKKKKVIVRIWLALVELQKQKWFSLI